MDQTLNILILEDSPTDEELIRFELEEGGLEFTFQWVTNESDYLAALRQYRPDLILSDYDLPLYDGAQALAEAKRRCPDTPFILVTGAIGEDRAIEILTQGAMDYVLKNRLHRLVPAVRRALAEAAEHRARKAAEEELRVAYATMEAEVRRRTAELQAEVDERRRAEERIRENEARFQKLYQSNPHPIFIWQRQADDFVLTDFNRAAKQIISEKAFGLIGKRAGDIYEGRMAVQEDLRRCFETKETVQKEVLSLHFMPGKLLKTTCVFVPPDLVMVHVEDVTASRRTERSLEENAQYLRRVMNAIFPFVSVLAPDGTLIEVNRAAVEAGGLLFEDCQGKKFWDCYWWNHSPALQRQLQEACAQAARGEELRYDVEVRMEGGRMMTVDFSLAPLFGDGGRVTHLVASAVDISGRKPAAART